MKSVAGHMRHRHNPKGAQAMMTRRAMFGAALAIPTIAQADGFPTRPVRMIIPFAPGGSSDLAGRLLAQHMTGASGHQFIVENRGGAGGDLAMMAGIASPPDGHTYVMGGDPWQVRNPVLRSDIPYDTDRALIPVARMVITWSVLAIPRSLPVTNLDEYVAYLRASRDPISYGTSGPGTLSHVLALLFMRRHGIAAEPVPYRGSSLALQDVAAGRLSLMCPTAGGLLPLLTGPHLRVLAITGATRQPMFPDAPTMIEAGMPEIDLNSWYGGMVPAGTPARVVGRLSELTGAALADPDVAKRLEDQGVASAYLPNPAFGAWIMAQRQLWRGIAERTNLRF